MVHGGSEVMMVTMRNTGLYERDFYAWANQQSALLRSGRVAEADLANIAEEIESMGRSEKRELANRLAVLLAHLLKWQYQPGRRGASWRLTIEEQRQRLAAHLSDNPSLKAALPESIAAARQTGRARADFPADCPWGFEQIVDDGFWPEQPVSRQVVED